ncbi:MAG: alpha-mannosidase, partial [Actinobacteria bacterium]|nr:alpha-mannosidase [Actinomycetota bacterium]
MDRPPGEVLEALVQAGGDSRRLLITVAEPGWTVWMVSHFHYDPVWWNTQAAYTMTWDELGEQAQRFRLAFQQTGFALVDAHVRAARLDPDYKFVVAEVDYLKPYWDARPEQRSVLRRLIADGRMEVMGGTYNEPNTNLTTAETTIRNFIYGAGFQRGVLG